MKTIGEKIYDLRKQKGVSQEKLAEELDVSRLTISRWENDNSRPTKKNIKRLCEILGVYKNYFFNGYGGVNVLQEVAPAATDNGYKIVTAIIVSVVLLSCIAGCFVAGYVALMPSYVNGLDNAAAANRFRYIGIVCIVVGALALFALVCLIIIFLKRKNNGKNN